MKETGHCLGFIRLQMH
uniref:Uncharacterized protein n=1 Tax=Rhizophora mucronata TaxID=61149 RepID=A0A2P2Q4K3_RHIMU